MSWHPRDNPSRCPACKSRHLVAGRVLGETGESGFAGRFYPRGLKFLTLRRSARLLSNQDFNACADCGHVWARLDADELRELVERSGAADLKKRLLPSGEGQ
jgi:DNA-directed RNA polymerase subunit RPC12/RpoP